MGKVTLVPCQPPGHQGDSDSGPSKQEEFNGLVRKLDKQPRDHRLLWGAINRYKSPKKRPYLTWVGSGKVTFMDW